MSTRDIHRFLELSMPDKLGLLQLVLNTGTPVTPAEGTCQQQFCFCAFALSSWEHVQTDGQDPYCGLRGWPHDNTMRWQWDRVIVCDSFSHRVSRACAAIQFVTWAPDWLIDWRTTERRGLGWFARRRHWRRCIYSWCSRDASSKLSSICAHVTVHVTRFTVT